VRLLGIRPAVKLMQRAAVVAMPENGPGAAVNHGGVRSFGVSKLIVVPGSESNRYVPYDE
jgi:hypothetical protein